MDQTPEHQEPIYETTVQLSKGQHTELFHIQTTHTNIAQKER